MNREQEESFVGFVERASPTLLRLAWLLTGDERTAEDLVQEALTRMYPRWSKLEQGTPTAYARRILVNLNLDRVRVRAREGLTRDGSVPEQASLPSGADDRDRLVRLLQTLPVRERQVVVLRHYADMSERETADMLQISIGGVKAAGSRGLSRLRQHIIDMEVSS